MSYKSVFSLNALLEGVGQMLMKADEGGGGVWKPPKLADIICGQPLIIFELYMAEH